MTQEERITLLGDRLHLVEKRLNLADEMRMEAERTTLADRAAFGMAMAVGAVLVGVALVA